MIYDLSTAPHLKPWLVRTLEPICDAEPGALADYILALLKHNVPEQEMRKELLAQLDEFLEKECPPFIDTLFTVLRTKSYLPYAPPSPPQKTVDHGIPIPLDLLTPPSVEASSSDRGLKRSMEGDERDGRPPSKGARVNSEAHFSRYGNGGRSSGQWDSRGEDGRGQGFMNGGMDAYAVSMMAMGMPHMNNGRRPQSYQPPDQKRGICRDYHNSGFCARGVMCKYSHGEDAMVPNQLYPMPPGMPFMPMFPGALPFGPGAVYDPHDARIDMRQRQPRAPILSRTQGDGIAATTSGELPVIQDLTPAIPQDPSMPPSTSTDSQLTSSDASQNNPQTQLLQQLQPMESFDPRNMQPVAYPPMLPQMQPQMDVDIRQGGHRGGFRGRGRGRGTFSGEAHSFRPEKRDGKTLVVEKIPEDKLSLENVNDWFKRFGTVTNVATDKMGGKALVSFSTHEEAHAAWKSEDAVFNNRFVKVFWHRPMEGQGQVGARRLAASTSVVANMGGSGSSSPVSSTPTAPVAARKAALSTNPTASALANKQQLLEHQIAEQKSLMAALDGATPEKKKIIMTRLRQLGEEMTMTSSSISVTSASNSKKSTPTVDTQEKQEKAQLDQEMETQAEVAPGSTEGTKDTAEDLKAKLEKLKAEAASLGLDAEASSSWSAVNTIYRGGYRGRVRGARGFFRGAPRGGPPRGGNMTLDNRPRKLTLKGVKPENIQAVKDWYESTNQLDTIDTTESGDVIVAFKTRAAAEQGLAKGTNIPMIGQVQVTWHAAKPAAVSSAPVTKPSDTNTSTENGEGHEARPHSPELEPEEEVIARGWGNNDDDGMGML